MASSSDHTGSDAPPRGTAPPLIRATAPALPTGGGAIRGIGETFSASSVTGTGSLQVPIAVTPGRAGFQPELALAYDSGAGNGPFGLGWQLSVPRITRKTDRRLPRYLDADESDVFLLSGAEDSVPALDDAGHRVGGQRDGVGFARYRPRTEGLYARIERRTDAGGDVHWVTITPDNVTHVYGRGPAARLADPADPRRIFSWLLERSEDALGNVIAYDYRAEDLVGVAASPAERHRLDGLAPIANRYLARVRYGNTTPGDAATCCFELVFDHGDHLTDEPAPAPGARWPVRRDPFSSYRAGFEVRTYRLCRRALMFHRFAELGPAPCLVASMRFGYDEDAGLTKLRTVERAGHVRKPDGTYEDLAMPPLELGYGAVVLHDQVGVLARDAGDLPAGIDGARDQWVDLDGEGIPGVLSDDGGALSYRRNLGGGALGPARPLATRPSMTAPGLGGQQLMALDGDGVLDLVGFGGPAPGFHERLPPAGGALDGDWSPLRTFGSLPTIPLDDPGLHFLDLDGDGRDDVLVVRDDALVWYPSLGAGGFGPPRRLPRPADDERGPALVFAGAEHTIFLADLGGDGLRDLVRVGNGQVCYWPNLGHGRFGAQVTMASPPTFDRPDQFDPKRILFADVDGSGPADLLYHGGDGVRLWFNQAGNAWGPMHSLPGLPPADAAVRVTAVDLLGTGTACLAWSTPLPADGGAGVRYVDLLAGKKPHLLESIDNHLGSTTRLGYAPSTKFYLADRAAGRPWATRLPFPVHVLERVETYDDVRRVRFVSEYAYRDGYYDGDEREFRGFAHVEQRDTERDPAPSGRGLFADRPAATNGELPQPPVVTRTWFHTGAWLATAPGLVDALPADLPPAESRDAWRALKGRMRRQEIFADDGSPRAAEPYRVTEHGYQVRRLQPADGDAPAVFATHPREVVERHLERDPGDPRVGHTFTLAVDEVGHVRRSLAIGYPRRPGAADERPEQRRLLAVLGEIDVANVLDRDDYFRHGAPIESRSYELTGLPTTTDLLTFAQVEAALAAAVTIAYDDAASPGPCRRLVERTCTRYYDSAALPAPLPRGRVDARALPYEQHGLAFTPDLIAGRYGDRVTGALLAEGGYVDLDGDGAWWSCSGRSLPDPARFYLPVAYRDPFGNPTAIAYDDHHLQITSVTDARGNLTRVELDRRVMAPVQITDANGNQARVAFDALGRVIARWDMGHPSRVEGDRPPAAPTVAIAYAFPDAATGTPSVVHTATREIHGDPSTRWQHAYLYADGAGREILKKVPAEPARWIGTGRTVLDNKGNPIKQYQPYFSDHPGYDTDEALVAHGVTPLLHYDPLGRLIRTEHPDGSGSRVTFTPWRQATWDANDTLGDAGNLWLARAQASPDAALRRAAALALDHAGTPTVVGFDSLGRAIATVADNKTEQLETRTTLDVEGNPLVVWDPLGRACLTRRYNLLGQVCHAISLDAGEHRALVDVAGQPLRRWDRLDDTHDRIVRAGYDALRRPTEIWTAITGGAEQLVERTVYGEDADLPGANRRGRIYQTFDGAGVATSEAYDHHGNLGATTRQLCADHRVTPDWSQAPALEPEIFRTATDHDALGRPIRTVAPDGSVTWPRYGEAGLLDGVDVQLRGAVARTPFVARIDHDEKGQRTRIVYGAADAPTATTTYAYDPLTFRLAALRTTRAAGLLQELAYTYDPVGNIAQIGDANQRPVYFDGQVVDGTALYWYQPTYRLAQAQAREHAGAMAAPRSDADLELAALPHPNDDGALVPYLERYDYDRAGNLRRVAHGRPGAPPSWTSGLRYAADGNRLAATTAAGDDVDQPQTWHGVYTYDVHGNTTSMPHLARLDWDWRNQLQRADKGGGGAVHFTYDGSRERVRKVWEHGAIVDERIYLGGLELYRRRRAGALVLERQTLRVLDGVQRIAMIETKTVDGDAIAAPLPVVRFQLGNHLGSVAIEVDERGRVISYEEYHPFGTSAYRAADAGEVSQKRYRYTGKERDEETGLAYHHARYYAPWLARWTAPDPAGLVDGTNLFAYCRGNPITGVDPNGCETNKARNEADTEVSSRNDPALYRHLKEMSPGARFDLAHAASGPFADRAAKMMTKYGMEMKETAAAPPTREWTPAEPTDEAAPPAPAAAKHEPWFHGAYGFAGLADSHRGLEAEALGIAGWDHEKGAYAGTLVGAGVELPLPRHIEIPAMHATERLYFFRTGERETENIFILEKQLWQNKTGRWSLGAGAFVNEQDPREIGLFGYGSFLYGTAGAGISVKLDVSLDDQLIRDCANAGVVCKPLPKGTPPPRKVDWLGGVVFSAARLFGVEQNLIDYTERMTDDYNAKYPDQKLVRDYPYTPRPR